MRPFEFCHACQQPYGHLAKDTWPKKCALCGTEVYGNPAPVVVALIPVVNGNEEFVGMLTVRRLLPPVGKLALPGGFIDHEEDWQKAIAREVREETGLSLLPSDFRSYALRSVGNLLLVFTDGPCIAKESLKTFKATSETSEVVVLPPEKFEEIAFPLHLEVAREFWTKRVWNRY